MEATEYTIPATSPRCAVVDCTERGRPQVCPYDGRYHHHGSIHYGTIPSALTFHKDAWDWICTGHYRQLEAEREAHHATVLA
jgi:hypothetical protein